MTRRILILFLTVPMVAFALKGGKLAAYEDWIAACEDENGICMAASDPSESPSSQTTPDTTYALWILRNDRKATIDGKIVAYNQPDKNAPTNIELHLNGKNLGTLILGDDAPATITPGNIIKEGNASATLTAETNRDADCRASAKSPPNYHSCGRRPATKHPCKKRLRCLARNRRFAQYNHTTGYKRGRPHTSTTKTAVNL